MIWLWTEVREKHVWCLWMRQIKRSPRSVFDFFHEADWRWYEWAKHELLLIAKMRALVHERRRDILERVIPLADVGMKAALLNFSLLSSEMMDTWLLEEGQSEILLWRSLIEFSVVLSKVCAFVRFSCPTCVCKFRTVGSFASQEFLPSSLMRCLPSSSPGASAQWFCSVVLRCYLPTFRLIFLKESSINAVPSSSFGSPFRQFLLSLLP
jgi:hypothetical protein